MRERKEERKQRARGPPTHLYCGERVCLGHKYGVHPGLVDTQPGADLAEDNLKIRRADFPHDPILHSLDVPSEVLHLRRKEKKRNGKREGRVGTGKGEG